MTQNCCSDGWYEKDVPIDHPDFSCLFLCDCPKGQAIRQQRLTRVLGASQIPPDYEDMTFVRFDPKQAVKLTFPDPQDKSREANRIRHRIHALDGKGLVGNVARAKEMALSFARDPRFFLTLMGESGCGKTHLAAAIAHHCLAKGTMVIFAVVPDLLDSLRATFDKGSRIGYDELMRTYLECDLLILDDLGTEYDTAWAAEKVYQIVNHRYNWRLPTVITTNEVSSDLDLRLQSRIFDARNIKFEILAGDYRPTQKLRRAA
jgi:DNA replication protein DnaC